MALTGSAVQLNDAYGGLITVQAGVNSQFAACSHNEPFFPIFWEDCPSWWTLEKNQHVLNKAGFFRNSETWAIVPILFQNWMELFGGFATLIAMVLVKELTDIEVGLSHPFPWYWPADCHLSCSPCETQCLLRALAHLETEMTLFRAIETSRRVSHKGNRSEAIGTLGQ